jgi:putative transferase (TIGR04331 family)
VSKINVCLTSIDHQVPHSDYDIFLGSWCNRSLEDLEKTLKNPIEDHKHLENIGEEVDKLLARILESLANYMNAYFNTKFSLRFWKIYLTPFLLHWLTTNYFRYLALTSLRLKIESAEDLLVFNFVKDENNFQIRNVSEFLGEIIYSDIYSHVSFQRLIGYMFEGQFEVANELSCSFNFNLPKKRKKSLRDNIREIASYGGKYYLGNVKGFNIIDKVWIAALNIKNISHAFLVSLRSAKRWNELKGSTSQSTNRKLTEWGFQPKTEFDEIISELVINSLPLSFYNSIPRQPFLKRVSYWIGNSSNVDQNELAYIGRIIENGGKWISAQHGGVYGHVLRNGISNIEYVLTDNFVTWGWTQSPPYDVKTIVLPSPILSKLKIKKKSRSNTILYVGTAGDQIPIRIGSAMSTIPLKEYKNIQLQFLLHLADDARASLKFRDHPLVPIPDHEFYQYLKKYNIPHCKQNASVAALESRIVIVDHCSTTFIETMVMNIPTLIFWNEAVCKLNSIARSYFVKLKEVGIWHESEIDAAFFLNTNLTNIETWWHSTQVQAARNEFLNQYGKTSARFIEDWAKFLTQLT